MSSQNVSWDIQDQNDRIISILAWVVVVVLVIYAGVYFYKQALGLSHRMGSFPTMGQRASLPERPGLGEALAHQAPLSSRVAPAIPPVGEPEASPVNSTVSYRPSPRQSDSERNASALVPHGARVDASAQSPVPRTIDSSVASGRGFAVRVGPFKTARDAHQKLLSIPVVVQDIDFPKKNGHWFLQVGRFATKGEASTLLQKMGAESGQGEVVAIGPNGDESDGEAHADVGSTHGQPVEPRAKRADLVTKDETMSRPGGESQTAEPRPASRVKGDLKRADSQAEGSDAPLSRPSNAATKARGGKTRPAATAKKTIRPESDSESDSAESAAEEGVAARRTAKRSSEEVSSDDGRDTARRTTPATRTSGRQREAAGAVSAEEPAEEKSVEPTRKVRRTVSPRENNDLDSSTSESATSEERPLVASASSAGRRPSSKVRVTSEEEDVTPESVVARATAASGSDGESEASIPATAARRASTGAGKYVLHVGSYTTEGRARDVAGELRNKGHLAKVDESEDEGRTVYRVRVGAYKDKRSATLQARRVSDELGKQVEVVSY